MPCLRGGSGRSAGGGRCDGGKDRVEQCWWGTLRSQTRFAAKHNCCGEVVMCSVPEGAWIADRSKRREQEERRRVQAVLHHGNATDNTSGVWGRDRWSQGVYNRTCQDRT